MTKRVRGQSLEQRALAFLRKRGGATRIADVMAHLAIDRLAASTALRRLLAKGSVTATGTTGDRMYCATSVRPDDWRGTSPGRVRALVIDNRGRRRTAPLHPKRYRPTTALERAWRTNGD